MSTLVTTVLIIDSLLLIGLLAVSIFIFINLEILIKNQPSIKWLFDSWQDLLSYLTFIEKQLGGERWKLRQKINEQHADEIFGSIKSKS